VSEVATEQPLTLTYESLDDLGEYVAAAVIAAWLLRPEMDEEEWLALVVRVLVGLTIQAEQWGRVFGSVAVPVDGVAIVPQDDTPRRPAPEDFEQVSDPIPEVTAEIDVAARSVELERRLEKTVRTLAADIERVEADEPLPPRDEARLERIFRDVPIEAAQRGYQNAIVLQVSAAADERVASDRVTAVVPADDSPLVLPGYREVPRTTSSAVRGYRRGINPDACELCFWLWKEGYVYPITQPMHRHTGCRCIPVPTTDPVGRWAMTSAEQTMLDTMYERYVVPRREKTRAARASGGAS